MRSKAEGFTPDLVAPNGQGDVSVAEFVHWLRDEGAAELVRQVDEAGPIESGAWQRELADPHRWVNAYAQASLATWHAIRPLWDSRINLIESEMERIGVAEVRGGGAELLNLVHPAISFSDDVLSIGTNRGPRLEVPVAGRKINLVPMIAASQSWYASVDGRDVITLAYGLPRSTVQHDLRAGDSVDAITLLLGLPRASALYFLAQPRRVGEVAQHLAVAPSTATHHCDLLESAGLVTRTRQGKSVLVSLTNRGRDLVEVLR